MAGLEQTQGMALQQTLSPQMQQSLQLLQAPLLELRQLVATELASNPTLEEESPAESTEVDDEPSPEASSDQEHSRNDEWNEYHVQQEPWSAAAQERWQYFLDSQSRPPSLQEHLMGEIGSMDLTARQKGIALSVVGNIDNQGYLRATAEEIAAQADCTPDDAETLIRKVQELDPVGVGARSLSECLLLQLQRREGAPALASQIAREHLENLGRRRYSEIAHALQVSVAEVHNAAQTIAQLEPRPGRPFSSEEERSILPDVIVEWDEDTLLVSLNDSALPTLRIGDSSKDLLAAPGSKGEVRSYLREKIRHGRFFLKCLAQRQETLLNISREIVTRQQAFFENGPAHLQPLTMNRVAEAVGVHETTVSRAVAGKYMRSPRGLFELKYFFTAGYTTADGETVSNESVRQAIAELVRTESPKSPLSDQALRERLAERGWNVARRTVAKYREQLKLPPSHLRKSF